MKTLSHFCLKRLALCLLFISPIASNAQKDPAKAEALRKIFKDDKIAATSFQTEYEFTIEKDVLVADERDDIAMISLTANHQTSREVFYNDHIVVVSAKLQTPGEVAYNPEKTCGNYEVDDIFYSDAKVCSYRMKFPFEGSQLVFRSMSRYDDPRYLTKVFFHDEMGVEVRTVKFMIPLSANVELVEMNFEGFEIAKQVSSSAEAKTYTYTVRNLKGIEQEDHSLGFLHYYPHIIVVTKDYTAKSGKKSVVASSDDLYNWYSGIVSQVNNDPAAFKEEVTRLTSACETPEEKIKAIYYWVQDNIKYIAFEDGISGFKPASAQSVYYNRYGDCKGMANLTKEMLKVAGFDARLTWIGTNRIPYTYELPSLAVDNHMICTVNVGNTLYVLDPTEKFIGLGKHGERIQGKEMMIENGTSYEIKKVPVADADQNLIFRNEEIFLEGETLKGKGEIKVNGEAMKNILYVSTNIKQENQKKLFESLVVSDFTNSDKVEVLNTPPVDRDKTLEVQYAYGLNNKVTAFDNDLYIDIDWSKNFNNMKIEDDRMSDYYFNRKVKNRVTKKLNIPAGYRVSHIPPGMKKQHKDFSFEVSFEQKGNALFYTNEIVISNGIIKKADFATWNDFIKELSEVYDDQIILTKGD